jgi:glyoxylase-like metal-dependent hydrolase (beta-lactamase superfamily II)
VRGCLGAALTALLLWAGGAGDATAALEATPVADGVWIVTGEAGLGSPANRNFISNAGFVVTSEGVVVIDALGSPALAEELIAEIHRVTKAPLRYVIVTHYHADHIYGLQAFKAQGAEVIAQSKGRDYLASETATQRLAASRQELAPWIDEKTHLVPADRWIDEELTLELGGERILVRHAGPAHTPEDLVVWVERAKVLFSGDLVFRGRIPFVGTADSSRWIEALERLLAFQPVLLVPGHGPPSRTPDADLRLTRDYLVFLRQAMADAAERMDPFEEAYARTDWSRFEGMPLFRAANRINAYNTYLLMEQQGPSKKR